MASSATLRDLCTLIADCPHSTPKWTNAGVVVLRSNNIRNGRLSLENPSYTDEETYQVRIRRAVPSAGDIVITREAPMGELCMVPPRLKCCLGQRMVLLRPDLSRVVPKFLLYALQSGPVQSLIQSHEGTGSTVSNLRIPALEGLPVPLIPKQQQEDAASLLGALDDRIESFQAENVTLERIARAIFKSWFVDFDPVRAKAEGREPEGMDAATAALFPCEFCSSEQGPIPLGWRVKSISEFSEANQKSIQKGYPHDEIEYVDISAVEPGRVSSTTRYSLGEAPSRARRLVSDGDVIWSCVRPNRRSFALLLEPEDNLVVSTGFVTLTATQAPFSFLYFAVTSNQFVDYLTQRADGAAYPAVRPDIFERAKVIVPTTDILKSFHQIADPMLRAIESNNRQATILADLRDTLLPRLISGKLRVPEAESMLSEVL